ncbi:MAG: hypothetical protein QXR53_03820 [Candidatus Norongarragalinales archaeon]
MKKRKVSAYSRDKTPIFKKVNGSFGEIRLPPNQKLWQVDGQHRIAGLRKLIDSFPPGDERVEEYPFPVIIICPNLWVDPKAAGLKNIEFTEMLQFVIMNKTQRGVPTDLAEQFLPHIKEEFGGTIGVSKANLPQQVISGIDWKPHALAIAEYLNRSSKVWSTRIQMANEEPRSGAFINQKAFTDSLEPIFKSDLKGTPTEILEKMLDHYWIAIRNICSEAHAQPTKYVLFRRTGVFVMNKLFRYIVLNYVDPNKEITAETFEKILRIIPKMKSEQWSTDCEWGAMGTSHKAINSMTEALIDSLKEHFEQAGIKSKFKVR